MSTAHLKPDLLINAVRQIITGSPPHDVAIACGIALTSLLDAVQTYHDAGIDALRNPTNDHTWHQTHIEFTKWNDAIAAMASHVAPELNRLCDNGLARRWWWIRKHPHWRVRIQREATVDREVMNAHLLGISQSLGPDTVWQSTIYEPETIAFGGATGMDIAHQHFSADSAFVLDHLTNTRPVLGTDETTLILCSAMLRGAGLDRFEVGEVWDRVARLRPPLDNAMRTTITRLTSDVTILTRLNTDDIIDSDHPLNPLAEWLTAFHDTGKRLATAATTGRLTRGLRATLTHTVIFHWNRLGLRAEKQALLANAAKRTTGL